MVGHVALTLRPGLAHPSNANQDVLPPAITPEFLRKQFIQQLNDKLDLTQQQKDQIKKIIEQGQENTRNLWKIVAPQFQEIGRNTRQQIREVLTPDQRKQFEMLMKQQHQLHHPQGTNAPAGLPPASTNAPVTPTVVTNQPHGLI